MRKLPLIYTFKITKNNAKNCILFCTIFCVIFLPLLRIYVCMHFTTDYVRRF